MQTKALAVWALCQAATLSTVATESLVTTAATSDSTPVWLVLPLLLDIQPALLKLDVKRHVPAQLQGFCREHGMERTRCGDAVRQALDEVVNFQRFCKQPTADQEVPGFVVAKSVLQDGGAASASWMQNNLVDIAWDLCSYVHRGPKLGVEADECFEAVESALSRSFEWLLALKPCHDQAEGSNEAIPSGVEGATISERSVTIDQMIQALKKTPMLESVAATSLSCEGMMATGDFFYDRNDVDEIIEDEQAAGEQANDAGAVEVNGELEVSEEPTIDQYNNLEAMEKNVVSSKVEESPNVVKRVDNSDIGGVPPSQRPEGDIVGTEGETASEPEDEQDDKADAIEDNEAPIVKEQPDSDAIVMASEEQAADVQDEGTGWFAGTCTLDVDDESLCEELDNPQKVEGASEITRAAGCEVADELNNSCEAGYQSAFEKELDRIGEQLLNHQTWKVSVTLFLGLAVGVVVIDIMLTCLHHAYWVPKQMGWLVLNGISLVIIGGPLSTLSNEERIEIPEVPIENEEMAPRAEVTSDQNRTESIESGDTASTVSPVVDLSPTLVAEQESTGPSVDEDYPIREMPTPNAIEAQDNSTDPTYEPTEQNDIDVSDYNEEASEEIAPEENQEDSVDPVVGNSSTQHVIPSEDRRVLDHSLATFSILRSSYHPAPSTSFACLAMVLMIGRHAPVCQRRDVTSSFSLSSSEVVSIIRQKSGRERAAVRRIQRAWKASRTHRLHAQGYGNTGAQAGLTPLIDEVLRSTIRTRAPVFRLLQITNKVNQPTPQLAHTGSSFHHLVSNVLPPIA